MGTSLLFADYTIATARSPLSVTEDNSRKQTCKLIILLLSKSIVCPGAIEKLSPFFYRRSAISNGALAIISSPQVKAMDFDSAVKTLNKILREKRLHTFNSSWIRKHVPHVYRFFRKNVRRESGGIDWDRITRALDRKFSRKWTMPRRNGTKLYRSKAEVNMILNKYEGKLYTFLVPADRDNDSSRDIISIALVRIAQKGNVAAKKEIITLVRFTIDEWIEHNPKISRWKGYEYLITKRIEHCIRRYRYSGSFMGYLFKTLEYAGRGLRPITVHYLEDSSYPGGRKRIDIMAQNLETDEMLI
jgi:hypothetical protein